MSSTETYTNRLIHEKSPYLLQHAHNPVDWYPWGEAAFAKARAENKPIFLSVGYATCHWCHVMERESFENEAIAAILNEHFIAIKVDREERPDVDRVYMAYVQATTEGGGWPMNVWLTPELKPFMGGTYFPVDDRWGRLGFRSVLTAIVQAWAKDRDRIVASSDAVLAELRRTTTIQEDAVVALERSLLDDTYAAIKASYDPELGGFGGAPKFPRPAAPNFMLRYYAETGAREALDMTRFTLRQMAKGGIYDHLGGGFHRYAVDAHWHVPHFEKMLYDQGQLVCTYLDAYQVTHDEAFADVARGVLDYVRRDMTGEDGRFYSAEDADSLRPETSGEHAEGAFYVWEQAEIVDILGAEQAAVFNFVYGVAADGNVRSDPQHEFENQNVLFAAHTLAEAATRFDMPIDTLREQMAAAKQTLFKARALRPRPLRDDKTITAWNGLMISGFARAYQVLGNEADLTAAIAAARFLRAHLYDEGRGVLLRRYRDGAAAIDGYVDDYAFLIQGLLDLYEAGFDTGYLAWALELQARQDALFWDEVAGGYFNTSGQDDAILLRMKEAYDGAEPSPNSVALLNLLRLAQMTDREGLRDKAERTLAAFGGTLQRRPHAMPQMMAAFAFHLSTPKQIVIAGVPDAPDTRALLRTVHAEFIPNKILLLADGGAGQAQLAQWLPFVKDIVPVAGKATAYVCKNYACKLPVNDTAALADLLAAPAPTQREPAP